MEIENAKIDGDLILNTDLRLNGMVDGSVTVPAGKKLWLHGTVTGDLLVKIGGAAVFHGTVDGSVHADGPTSVFGVVGGSVLGGSATIDPGAVVGGA